MQARCTHLRMIVISSGVSILWTGPITGFRWKTEVLADESTRLTKQALTSLRPSHLPQPLDTAHTSVPNRCPDDPIPDGFY
jgi:hypothetical protein